MSSCIRIGLTVEPKVLALARVRFLWRVPYLERVQGVLDGGAKGSCGTPGPLALAALLARAPDGIEQLVENRWVDQRRPGRNRSSQPGGSWFKRVGRKALRKARIHHITGMGVRKKRPMGFK